MDDLNDTDYRLVTLTQRQLLTSAVLITLHLTESAIYRRIMTQK